MNWSGVYPAVTTKFTEDDKLDIGNFRLNIAAQVEAGVSGVILGGTLGEASSLTNEEKLVLLDNAIEETGSAASVIVKFKLFCAAQRNKRG